MSPVRARRRCSTPGCAALAATKGKCARCARRARDRYDAQRGTPASRGYDARHREWREEVLRRDPVCRSCGTERSTVADHVLPIRQGGARFALSNGQGLCHGCHNAKTARDGSRT